MIIASESYINKSVQKTKLLIKYLLSTITPALKRKAPVREPRPKGRPRKNLAIEPTTTALQITIDEFDLQIKPEANKEIAMSITETCSKIYEPKSYNKTMNNPIYCQRWRETIENKLQNLENYQT